MSDDNTISIRSDLSNNIWEILEDGTPNKLPAVTPAERQFRVFAETFNTIMKETDSQAYNIIKADIRHVELSNKMIQKRQELITEKHTLNSNIDVALQYLNIITEVLDRISNHKDIVLHQTSETRRSARPPAAAEFNNEDVVNAHRVLLMKHSRNLNEIYQIFSNSASNLYHAAAQSRQLLHDFSNLTSYYRIQYSKYATSIEQTLLHLSPTYAGLFMQQQQQQQQQQHLMQTQQHYNTNLSFASRFIPTAVSIFHVDSRRGDADPSGGGSTSRTGEARPTGKPQLSITTVAHIDPRVVIYRRLDGGIATKAFQRLIQQCESALLQCKSLGHLNARTLVSLAESLSLPIPILRVLIKAVPTTNANTHSSANKMNPFHPSTDPDRWTALLFSLHTNQQNHLTSSLFQRFKLEMKSVQLPFATIYLKDNIIYVDFPPPLQGFRIHTTSNQLTFLSGSSQTVTADLPSLQKQNEPSFPAPCGVDFPLLFLTLHYIHMCSYITSNTIQYTMPMLRKAVNSLAFAPFLSSELKMGHHSMGVVHDSAQISIADACMYNTTIAHQQISSYFASFIPRVVQNHQYHGNTTNAGLPQTSMTSQHQRLLWNQLQPSRNFVTNFSVLSEQRFGKIRRLYDELKRVQANIKSYNENISQVERDLQQRRAELTEEMNREYQIHDNIKRLHQENTALQKTYQELQRGRGEYLAKAEKHNQQLHLLQQQQKGQHTHLQQQLQTQQHPLYLASILAQVQPSMDRTFLHSNASGGGLGSGSDPYSPLTCDHDRILSTYSFSSHNLLEYVIIHLHTSHIVHYIKTQSVKWQARIQKYNYIYTRLYHQQLKLTISSTCQSLRIAEHTPSTPPTYQFVSSKSLSTSPNTLFIQLWFTPSTRYCRPSHASKIQPVMLFKMCISHGFITTTIFQALSFYISQFTRQKSHHVPTQLLNIYDSSIIVAEHSMSLVEALEFIQRTLQSFDF